MKKSVLPLLALLMLFPCYSHAQNISADSSRYISSPVITDGETVLHDLGANTDYSGYKLTFSIEKRFEDSKTENLLAAAAIYDGNALIWTDAAQADTDDSISLVSFDLPDFYTGSDFCIKTFVWEEDMTNLCDAYEIPVVSDTSSLNRYRVFTAPAQILRPFCKSFHRAADSAILITAPPTEPTGLRRRR